MGLKMDGDEEAITTIIANAIAAPEGHLRLAKAEEFIIGEVERNRFNTERAVEIYTVAVDNSVWAWTKGTTLGKLMYRATNEVAWAKNSQLNSPRILRREVAFYRLRTNGHPGGSCASCSVLRACIPPKFPTNFAI
jgi:hypothetical protein